MAKTFEELVDNMVNIGFGVAAVAADKSKEVLDGLSTRGAEARADVRESDFSRSVADVFEQAGGAFTDVTERLSAQGSSVAERVLDELILARVRPMTATERAAFVSHVSDLVDSADNAVKVEIEVEVEAGDDSTDADVADAAADDAPADAEDATDAA